MMRNDDLTIYARSKNWDLFSPDWGYLLEFPALELRSLCALSVGLRPQLADTGWVFTVALPHFDASDRDECFDSGLDDAHVDTFRVAPLLEFLRRLPIAARSLAPLGALPIAVGEPNGEQTMVHVADFATWAKGKGWAIPPEFSGFIETPLAPAQVKSEAQKGRSSDEHKPRHRLDNLGRAVLDALNHLPPGPTIQQVFDHLASKDDTGYIRGRDGDELTWVNERGDQSRTSKKALANRLPRLIREHEAAR